MLIKVTWDLSVWATLDSSNSNTSSVNLGFYSTKEKVVGTWKQRMLHKEVVLALGKCTGMKVTDKHNSVLSCHIL